MKNIEIRSEPIELFKLLKFENLVESGGAAKHAIENELVQLNGEIETRKRKKIIAGDVITFGGEDYKVSLEK